MPWLIGLPALPKARNTVSDFKPLLALRSRPCVSALDSQRGTQTSERCRQSQPMAAWKACFISLTNRSQPVRRANSMVCAAAASAWGMACLLQHRASQGIDNGRYPWGSTGIAWSLSQCPSLGRYGPCAIAVIYQNAHHPRTNRLANRARKSRDQTVMTIFQKRFAARSAKRTKIGNIDKA